MRQLGYWSLGGEALRGIGLFASVRAVHAWLMSYPPPRWPTCPPCRWTPIPIVTWLVPFIGHMGVCTSEGVILDFAGPYFVSVDNLAFGRAARQFLPCPYLHPYVS